MLLFLQLPWLNSFEYWSKWPLKGLNPTLVFHFFFPVIDAGMLHKAVYSPSKFYSCVLKPIPCIDGTMNCICNWKKKHSLLLEIQFIADYVG